MRIVAPSQPFALTNDEFASIQALFFKHSGIRLSQAKKPLIAGRLAKRIRHHGCASFREYLRLLGRGQEELRIAIDLLTTNETHFFREPKHFQFLSQWAVGSGVPSPRVWSAACSSGEEPYSIAMTLADVRGIGSWQILASDLSQRVLDAARAGRYPMAAADRIPNALLQRYCLRGVGRCDGQFAIGDALKAKVTFSEINLSQPLPNLIDFDLIFLRNVMIYFEPEMKRQILARLIACLKPGGYLLIGHSESLHGLTEAVRPMAPAIYRKDR